jgi:hypothetical protein
VRVIFHELAEREVDDAAQFLYALLYSAGSDDIRILAVMHLKRRPSYWVARS